MPSQKQLHWAQLRVGITVVVAFITLAILILMMNGGGFFTKTIKVRTYFENSGGLKEGAPVHLQGVDIGNVTKIKIVMDTEHKKTPVEVIMKLNLQYEKALHKDSTAMLTTAGVLGDTFVDIDSQTATGPLLQDGDVLASKSAPGLNDIIKSAQSTVEKVDTILTRVDDMAQAIQDKRGTIGEIIYDKRLVNQLAETLSALQKLVNQVGSGQGTVGKLIGSDELYQKLNGSVDRVNHLLDGVEKGEGTIGKFLKDPSLYNNANQTISKTNQLLDGIHAGHGTAGLLVRDEAFAKKLDDTMTRLQSIMTRVDNGEGSIGKLLHDDAVYNHLDGVLVESQTLVKTIRENPKKYLTIHMKIF